jgi:hypothetical protein
MLLLLDLVLDSIPPSTPPITPMVYLEDTSPTHSSHKDTISPHMEEICNTWKAPIPRQQIYLNQRNDTHTTLLYKETTPYLPLYKYAIDTTLYVDTQRLLAYAVYKYV